MALVYMAIFPNFKVYIGVNKSDKFIRKYQHMSDSRRDRYKNNAFHNAIRKYGEPEWLILADGLSIEEALSAEILLIDYYKSTTKNGFGYNTSNGGKAGFNGTKHSIDSKMKISQKMSERFLEQSVREKHKQSVNTERHRLLFQESWKRYIDNGGREVLKLKMKKFAKPIICNETGEVFPSIAEAARKTGLFKSLIQKVLKGKTKSTGGLTFSFIILNLEML